MTQELAAIDADAADDAVGAADVKDNPGLRKVLKKARGLVAKLRQSGLMTELLDGYQVEHKAQGLIDMEAALRVLVCERSSWTWRRWTWRRWRSRGRYMQICTSRRLPSLVRQLQQSLSLRVLTPRLTAV